MIRFPRRSTAGTSAGEVAILLLYFLVVTLIGMCEVSKGY